MAKRKTISTTTRFEVFKRDSFKCQYCGKAAPEVVLEIEHIEPHSKGGSDDMLNLVTSCWACNNGKSDRRLSDDAALLKQRVELEELQARRDQLEMMLRWRNENVAAEEDAVSMFAKEYERLVPGYELNETGLQSAKLLIKKFGAARALTALDEAAVQVIRFDRKGKVDKASTAKLFGAIFIQAEPPEIRELYRIRGWVRGRWNNVHDGRAIGLLRRLHAAGASVEEIAEQTSDAMKESGTSFNYWLQVMEQWLSELKAGG